MKKFFMILILTGSTLLAASVSEMKVKVKGMVCAFCAQGIKKNLKKHDEVESVSVNLEQKLITVKFKDGKSLSQDTVSEIIQDAGYEAEF